MAPAEILITNILSSTHLLYIPMSLYFPAPIIPLHFVANQHFIMYFVQPNNYAYSGMNGILSISH